MRKEETERHEGAEIFIYIFGKSSIRIVRLPLSGFIVFCASFDATTGTATAIAAGAFTHSIWNSVVGFVRVKVRRLVVYYVALLLHKFSLQKRIEENIQINFMKIFLLMPPLPPSLLLFPFRECLISICRCTLSSIFFVAVIFTFTYFVDILLRLELFRL